MSTASTREKVTEQVIRAAAFHSNMNEDEINTETTLEELGLDSLDRVELILALEEDFGDEIPDTVCDKWETIGDAVNYIAAHE